MARVALDLRAALAVILGFSLTMAAVTLCTGCGAVVDCEPDGFEPVAITVPPAHVSSLVTAPCILVARDGQCGVEAGRCVSVSPGERVTLWFPTDGVCGADGMIYPDGTQTVPTQLPGQAWDGPLIYSPEGCP